MTELSETLTIKVSKKLLKKLNKFSEDNMLNRSALVRKAIWNIIKKKGRK